MLPYLTFLLFFTYSLLYFCFFMSLILDKVNTHLRTILNVKQWRNTQNVIEWFGNIEQKSRHSFISFDIVI